MRISVYLTFIFVLLMLISAKPLKGQHKSLQLQLSLRKTYKLEEKHRLRWQQTLQLSPRLDALLDMATSEPEFEEIDFVDNQLLKASSDEEDDSEEDDENETEEEDDDDDDDLINNPTLPSPIVVSPSESAGWNERLIWRANSSIQYEYRLNRMLRFNAGYDLTLRPGPASHRLVFDARSLHRLGKSPLRFDSRLRWQSNFRPREGELRISHYTRLRLRFRLSGNVSPFWAGEIFYRLRTGDSEFRLFRLGTGFIVRFNKQQRLRIAYQYSAQLNRRDPSRSQRIQFEWIYQF